MLCSDIALGGLSDPVGDGSGIVGAAVDGARVLSKMRAYSTTHGHAAF